MCIHVHVYLCLILPSFEWLLLLLQDEQQIKHYREDTAKMREQIAELQTRLVAKCIGDVHVARTQCGRENIYMYISIYLSMSWCWEVSFW